MLIEIEDKKLELRIDKSALEIPQELKEKISVNWKKALEKTPELWNGDVICVTECKEYEDKIILNCKQTDYAHYLYDERVGCPKEYASHGLSGGTLFETLDGYYVVGITNDTTSYPTCLQFPGGGIDKKDISNECIDIYSTMRREAIEEINIDINNKNQVLSHEIKYISLPNEFISGYEVVGKAKLNLTSNQMKEHYDKYLEYLKQNNLEIEFKKILLLKKEQALESLDKLENPRRKYMRLVMQADNN